MLAVSLCSRHYHQPAFPLRGVALAVIFLEEVTTLEKVCKCDHSPHDLHDVGVQMYQQVTLKHVL